MSSVRPGRRRRKGSRGKSRRDRGGDDDTKQEPLQRTTTLDAASVGSGEASISHMRMLLSADESGDGPDAVSAMDVDDELAAQTSRDADSLGQFSVYEATVDHDLFEYSLSVGRGPAVTDGEPDVATTLTGAVEHYFGDPYVDYVVADVTPGSASDHIEAYLAGVERLAEVHADSGFDKFERLADDLTDALAESQAQVADSVDESLEVVESSALGVSGVPNYLQYVEAPSGGSAVEATKRDYWKCGARCAWKGNYFCCGCGVGLGVCYWPPSTLYRVCTCCGVIAGCLAGCCAARDKLLSDGTYWTYG